MSRETARRGFTLIELLVVMAVIGILLTIATPTFRRALPGAELESSIREIASVLREARSVAIRTNQDTGVVFDVEMSSFAVAGGAQQRVGGQLTLTLTTAASEQISDSTGGIRFFPDGTSTGGRITVSGGDRVRFIVVDWLTGNVEIVKRDENG
jgi:general secretion pathway protein H